MHIKSLASLLLAGIIGAVSLAHSSCARADSASPDAEEESLRVLGWLENIRLLPSNWPMKARLDSGAKSNAIHARDIERFEKDGKDWVRFTVLRDHLDPGGRSRVVERPVVGEVAIKLRGATPRSDERLVVRLEFCLAGERRNALFTLANRANFNYPVLLGRDFLAGSFLIDSSESFTHKASCLRQ